MSQRVAYVTGGMGGIGTSICQRLHKDGFKVIAGCGPTRDFDKWLAEQKALGYTFYASVGNVADWNSTVEAFGKAKAEHGPIDVLVNNAGITRDRMFLKGAGAASSRFRRSTATRARPARPTTLRPRPACTASRWRWRRKWPPRV